MRTRLRGKITLLFVVCAALLAVPVIAAVADTLNDELTGNNLNQNTVTVTQNDPGGFVNSFHVRAQNSGANVAGDCDVSASAPATFQINTPAGVTATPNTLTFTQCGTATTNTQDVKFTSSVLADPGHVINVTQTGGNSIGTGAAEFRLKVVAPADTTAPVISKVVTGTQGDNGWYTSNVGVDWTVSDPQSAISSQSGCADFDVTSDQGATTYTCTATSAGGTSSDSVTIKRDATAPSVNCGTADADWHADDVNIACTASDGGSGLANAGDASFNLSTSVANGVENSNASTGSRTVLDAAGNSATAGPIAGNKIDKKAPSFNCGTADADWHATNQTFNCTANDGGSGLTPTSDANFSLSTTVAAGNETNNASTGTKTLTDGVGNTVTAPAITGVKVDMKAPVLTDESPTTTPNGNGGWYTSAVTNGFKATDGGSGFAPNGDLTKSFTNSSGANEGSAVKIASGPVSDAVGNSATSIDSAAFKIDLSDPTNVQFSGGPDAGSSHYFGSVPAAPTCTAEDAISGMPANGCVVTGYSTAVGTHTMTATATDNAGRTATAQRTYTVLAWTTKGFYQPVDMGGVYNTVKGGSTVPLKFELFSGATELTDTSAIKSLTATKSTCAAGATEDAIEVTATGGTSLRYDSTGGQFIYNWKTPTGVGCYTVTMTAQDGSTITAYFKSLK